MIRNLKNDIKITLTGDLGSGKSTVSRILCEKTGFEYVSTGRVQRQLATEMGLDTLALNRLADTDPTIDQRIDGLFAGLATDPSPYIVDSRMAWFFLPQSFKVYLTASPEAAAQRIFGDESRKASEDYTSPEEAAAKIRARKKSENQRFLVKYGADCSNLSNYDLVVDTTHLGPQQVAAIILRAAARWSQGLAFRRNRKGAAVPAL